MYLLEGTSKVDPSTKKKVRMLYKWLCVRYLWNSGIVLKSESCLSCCFQTGFISLWSICDLLLLAVWEAAEHSSAPFTPNSRIVMERVHIWIFSFAMHMLHFRKKAALPPDPRLQPESCLLLQPTPTRGGQKARVSSRTNTYILVDSGLRVRSPQIKNFAFKILLRVCKEKYSGCIV